MLYLLLDDIVGGIDPPKVQITNPIIPILLLFLVITILIIIGNLIAKSFRKKDAQSKLNQDKSYLTAEEIKMLKAFRASKNLPNDTDISFQTLSDEELRLLQEFRKQT